MRRGALVAAAFALDLLAGDPRWFPHPVRAIGAAIARLEPRIRARAGDGPWNELAGGAFLTAAIVAGASLATMPVHRRCAWLEIACAWTSLALRDLVAEATAVIVAGERGDLALARERLARIVGRDTARLNESEIARATIETLAESACDGVVAPLLALAAGGVPAAGAFKAASTLDSTIGHIEAPYRHFGRAAARLDDALCYLPARATALGICALAPLAGGSVRRALATLRTDGAKHRSPNAGRPEAAMAGALGVRLGGENVYDGVRREGAYFGAAFPPPDFADARRARRLVVTVSCAAAMIAALATWNVDAA